MATLSLGSGLRAGLATALFATQTTASTVNPSATGTQTTGSNGTNISATAAVAGLAGYYGSQYYNYPYYQTYNGYGSTFFSLMKGVVPSSVSDINTNQRATDEIIRYTVGMHTSTLSGTVGTYRLDDDRAPANMGVSLVNFSGFSGVTQSDFLITQDGATVAWNPIGVAFAPRACIRTGTPTWFWLRTNQNEHTVYGTVGATGSGADLEIDNYGSLSGTVSIYNSTILRFSVGNTASWSS